MPKNLLDIQETGDQQKHDNLIVIFHDIGHKIHMYLCNCGSYYVNMNT